MKTTQRLIANLTILRVNNMDHDRFEPRAFRSAVAALVTQGRVNVAINLSGVHALDAEGLGALAADFTLLRELGGGLALIAPQERVKRLLSVTRLDTVLPVFPTERDAVNHRRAETWDAADPTDWISLPACMIGA